MNNGVRDGEADVIFLPKKKQWEIVLVGINYDEKTKEHSCRIERIRS